MADDKEAESALLLQQKDERIESLEQQLQQERDKVAQVSEQLSIVRTLLLLKNIERQGEPSTTIDKATRQVLSSKTSRPDQVSPNDTSPGDGEVEGKTTTNVAITQLRKLRLIKHSWRLLREDVVLLQLGSSSNVHV